MAVTNVSSAQTAFAAALQEWQTHRAQGGVALAALQGLLGQLEETPVLPGSVKFWQRITSQAGSDALASYIAARGRMPALKARATVPEQIDQALQQLHTSLTACDGLLTRLQAAAANMEEAAVSALSDTEERTPAEDALRSAALLVSSITDSVEREHVMMRLVVGEVGLETPPTELETYATLWRLVPYVNDEAVSQLLVTPE